MSEAHLSLAKWNSNDISVLEHIPVQERAASANLLIYDPPSDSDTSSVVNKALGLQWDPISDNFTFKDPKLGSNQPTKRIVASESLKVFDPLGFLAPFLLLAKIILQKILAA